MRAEQPRVQSYTADPLGDEAGILSGRYAAIGTATAGEQELAGPLVGGPQIVVDGLARLIAQFRPDRPLCFPLSYGRAIRCVASLTVLRRTVIQLRSGSLRLDETGFELAGYRREHYLWSEVGDFRVERSRGFEAVGFRVRPPKDDPDAPLNLRFFGGRDVWLPDSYGYDLEDLAQLMAAWQRRATKQ